MHKKTPHKVPFKRWLSKTEYAETLRLNMTEAERCLWKILARHMYDWGVEFKPQCVVLGYIPDFYCEDLLLAVEVDGRIHSRKDVKRNDRKRTKHLNAGGVKVIRFTNLQCLTSPHTVVQAIHHTVLGLRRR